MASTRGRSDFDVDVVEQYGEDLGPNYLSDKHSGMTFQISAPMFVWNELPLEGIEVIHVFPANHHSHIEGVFYIPTSSRPLIETPNGYEIGEMGQITTTAGNLAEAYRVAWEAYENLLGHQVTNEVARLCLPMAVYSTAYLTTNLAELMRILSKEGMSFETAKVVSQMELLFRQKFPMLWRAFTKNGRVAP